MQSFPVSRTSPEDPINLRRVNPDKTSTGNIVGGEASKAVDRRGAEKGGDEQHDHKGGAKTSSSVCASIH